MIINTSIEYARKKNPTCIIDIKGLTSYPKDEYYNKYYNEEYNIIFKDLYTNIQRIYKNDITYNVKDHIIHMTYDILNNIKLLFNTIKEDVKDVYDITDEEIIKSVYPYDDEEEELYYIDDDIFKYELEFREKFKNYSYIDLINIVNSYYKVPYMNRNIYSFKKIYFDDVIYFMDHPKFNMLYQYCKYLINLFDYLHFKYDNILDVLYYDNMIISDLLDMGV